MNQKFDSFLIRQLFPGAPAPKRADPTLLGTAPFRAVSYCEPFTEANKCGWHAFLPFDVILRWDGSTVYWLSPAVGGWLQLGAAMFPCTDNLQSEDRSRRLPPLLTGLPEPGLVQLWPGLVARSPRDWLLAIRPPVNFSRSLGYEMFEGIVDTAWWFGPLVTTIRICKTDEPITLSSKLPIYTLSPVWRPTIHESLYHGAKLEAGSESMTSIDWDDFDKAIALHREGGRPGGYKREAQFHRRERDNDRDR
jgi:hypothetical protein